MLTDFQLVEKLNRELLTVSQLRVWSLLITILGDAAPTPGKEIANTWLTQLFQSINITPEAFRVALHRLKKEGWIETRREGRLSYSSLSSTALTETNQVWDKIYHVTPNSASPWKLCILENQHVELPPNAIKLKSHVYAIPVDQVTRKESYLVFDWNDQDFPNWLSQSEAFSPILTVAQSLNRILNEPRLPSCNSDDLSAYALRFLVLHYWRIIALKDASWLHMRHVPNSEIAQCHDRVKRLLKHTHELKIYR